jgi:tetratricopeptide (TPR) repeat protein
MNKTRLEFLRETLAAKPDDAFARYALALELSNSEKPEDAWEHFDYLLRRQPEYSATYYQAGTFLARQGRRDEAREIFSKGIEVTGRQGNLHAQSELQKALDELGD